MARKDKAPPPILILRGGHLTPASAYDAEEIGRFPDGSEFDLVSRKRRSLPHLGKYFAILARTLSATGNETWPTAEKLHASLKLSLGYVTMVWDADRKYWVPQIDSVAFDSMDQGEFNDYYERAMRRLSEWLGFNVEDFE